MSKIESGLLLDGRYRLLHPLSSDGGTADVWLALDTNTIDEVYDDDTGETCAREETGIKVAIKIYRPKNALDFGEQRFRDEFKIVFNCHHTNLVQPINFSIFEGIPYLVLPYCRNGSSEQLVGSAMSDDDLWRYIRDVSAGLAYLHAFQPTIVHHDVKPANVLVDDSDNFSLTDFGISSHRGLNRDGYDDNQSGTLAYMAPERFKEDYESSPESDMWSFGATLYELITGRMPFGESGGLEQLQRNLTVPTISKPVPKDIKQLVYDCLSPDPAKRPSASKVNKAALARRYPAGRGRLIGVLGVLCACVLAAVLYAVFKPGAPETPVDPQPRQPSAAESMSSAMALVNSGDAATLTAGMSMLDSLASTGYVPALYEQAHTYGWYTDSVSMSRKCLLGIDVYPEGTSNACLPKSNKINNKAVGLLSRIEEIGDSAYPQINADALYRLASYYIATDKVFRYNPARASELLLQSRDWAQMCGDTLLLRRIDNTLKQINLNN